MVLTKLSDLMIPIYAILRVPSHRHTFERYQLILSGVQLISLVTEGRLGVELRQLFHSSLCLPPFRSVEFISPSSITDLGQPSGIKNSVDYGVVASIDPTDMNATLITRLDANTEVVDGPSSEDSNHPPTTPTPASCTLCRRRKVKCDRTIPCGNCQRSRAQCVPFIPSRVARGRQGGRKRKREEGELLERIAKLEGLVRTIEGHEMPQSDQERTVGEGTVDAVNTNTGSESPGSHDRKQPAPRLDKYLATSFWVSLSEEIHGLKDVLGESSDDEDEDEGERPDLSSLGQQYLQQANHSGFAIIRKTIAEDIIVPKTHQVYTFCDIYLANVDPIFKILHGPSLRKYLQENAAELDCSPGRGGLEALRFAIYYAAVTSMDDGECKHRIGENRTVLLARYRAGTELALAKADFINTVEMSTLQALAIYLVGALSTAREVRFLWVILAYNVLGVCASQRYQPSHMDAHKPCGPHR